MSEKKWLEKIIKNKEKKSKLKENNNVKLCCHNDFRIHIFDGIEILSKKLCKTLSCSDFNDEYAKIYFIYKNYEVFQLIEKGDK